jgi:hypothetical protein
MSGVLHGVVASLKAAAAAATDAFFEYVTLLLNTSATNGAQNNTFLDSSTNNFSITRNGDTTQGSFNPYMPSGYWSGYFDGNGDYLTLADNAAFELGAGDFTIEAWIYPTAYANLNNGVYYSDIFSKDQNLLREFGFYISGTASSYTALRFIGFSNNTTFTDIIGTQTFNLNTWYHVAAVRSGNNVYLYVNGVQVNSTTAFSQTIQDTASVVYVGARLFDASNLYYFPGHISNLRLVKGTAVYTANFTPPTTPLTAITNTSLLCLQDNRFKDNSTNAFAITVNGDTRISKFAPFNPPASYSTASYGGSGYFDGTGDYLSIADSATIRFGTGTFTIQGWVYRGAAGATHTIAAKGGGSTGWVLQITSTNVLRFTDTTTNIDTTTTIPASTWAHVAVVRTGTGANGLKLYINAVDSATGTSSTNFNQTDALNIGADRSNANAFNGYISNLKYTVGTAESISVPASPITGGTVLLNFTNAGIYDAATINDGQTVGNAQVSTTQAKWSPTSISFDGTGDYVTVIDKPELRIGTGDFTIEGWVYLTATGVAYGLVSKGTASTGWSVNVTSGNKLQFSYTATQLTGATSLVSGTWYYFAVVRSGTASGNLRVILDGSTDATSAGAVNDNFNQTNVLYVGADRVAGAVLNGYLQDVRITNGYARTTSTPTAAFPTL